MTTPRCHEPYSRAVVWTTTRGPAQPIGAEGVSEPIERTTQTTSVVLPPPAPSSVVETYHRFSKGWYRVWSSDYEMNYDKSHN
ncbi:hypothetical protein KY290_003559 [Solanum tuberosum]|uniref:Integrase core domain containing protein n=1 Tax=Solanum tuberosum TaxID=4113 RepID=A0ABQ7WUM8_SOLTU|nr:hypothetical protein KY290_003559 [Solanum tuberosum]